MENLRLYEQGRTVPKEAQKTIKGGRISGFTDINPMWRIKKLTEMFGPVGECWYFKVLNGWTCAGADGVEIINVEIELYYKLSNGEWSMPIYGVGGNQLIAKEKNGLYSDDEAYKKATTDAIGSACKLLGIGAEIYWDNDPTKYDTPQETAKRTRKTEQTTKQTIKDHTTTASETDPLSEEEKKQAEGIERLKKEPISELQITSILSLCTQKGIDRKVIEEAYKLQLKDFNSYQASRAIITLNKKPDMAQEAPGNAITSNQILEIMDLSKMKHIAVSAIEDKYSKKINQFNSADYAKAIGFLKGM